MTPRLGLGAPRVGSGFETTWAKAGAPERAASVSGKSLTVAISGLTLLLLLVTESGRWHRTPWARARLSPRKPYVDADSCISRHRIFFLRFFLAIYQWENQSCAQATHMQGAPRGLLRGQHAPPKVSGGAQTPSLGRTGTALVLFILSPCAHAGCSCWVLIVGAHQTVVK